MLHNMIIHEMALAVTYYKVTADNVATVTADQSLSVYETRGAFTDFRKLAFTIVTKCGASVRILGDRSAPLLPHTHSPAAVSCVGNGAAGSWCWC